MRCVFLCVLMLHHTLNLAHRCLPAIIRNMKAKKAQEQQQDMVQHAEKERCTMYVSVLYPFNTTAGAAAVPHRGQRHAHDGIADRSGRHAVGVCWFLYRLCYPGSAIIQAVQLITQYKSPYSFNLTA